MIRQSIIGSLIILSVSFSAVAQDPNLIEQAKKEGGKVIVYRSLESLTLNPLPQSSRVYTRTMLDRPDGYNQE